MFTGLIQETGTVRSILRENGGFSLEIAASVVPKGAAVGDSIAVNGICPAVVALDDGGIRADAMNETVRIGTLKDWRAGDTVNLEKSLTLQSPLGGHLVLGDVEATASVLSVEADGFAKRITFSVPAAVSRYIVKKGRIAVDGASLTVCDEAPGRFSVSLIPHTLKSIRLGSQKPGDTVNIETDILAKYVEKLLKPDANGVTESFLIENGFGS